MARHRFRNAEKENWIEALTDRTIQFLLQGRQEK